MYKRERVVLVLVVVSLLTAHVAFSGGQQDAGETGGSDSVCLVHHYFCISVHIDVDTGRTRDGRRCEPRREAGMRSEPAVIQNSTIKEIGNGESG